MSDTARTVQDSAVEVQEVECACQDPFCGKHSDRIDEAEVIRETEDAATKRRMARRRA